MATQIVDEYKEGADKVVSDIEKMGVDKSLVKDELISGVENGVKLLESIDKSVIEGGNVEKVIAQEEEDKKDEQLASTDGGGADESGDVVEAEVEDVIEVEEIYETGEYGIKIQGDKFLPPLFNF